MWWAPPAASLCFLVYACGIMPPGMDDVAFAEARIVEGVPVPESRDRPPGSGPWLRLTLSSTRNLAAMAHRSELNTYALIVDCGDRDRSLFSYGPYQDGLRASAYGDSRHPRFEAVRGRRAESFRYRLYLPITGGTRSEADSNRQLAPYDLATDRMTLCIRLGGGSMIGGHFRSNEIRLQLPSAITGAAVAARFPRSHSPATACSHERRYAERARGPPPAPGNRIALVHGVVFLNGRVRASAEEAAERYAEQFPGEAGPHEIYDTGPSVGDDFDEIAIPVGQVFVLGDNRDHSADSRFSPQDMGSGLVPIDRIRGRLAHSWGSSRPMGTPLGQ